MPVYDISLTISKDLPVWPDDMPISLVRNSDITTCSAASCTREPTHFHCSRRLASGRAPVLCARRARRLSDRSGQVDRPCQVIHLLHADSIGADTLLTKRLLSDRLDRLEVFTIHQCRRRAFSYGAGGLFGAAQTHIARDEYARQ